MKCNRRTASWITAACLVILLQPSARSAEIIVLCEENYDQVVPKGKEVDAIYGDFVLRNDRITAVVAEPLPTRNANMTVRRVGGSLIDLTERDASNDQLSAFYPLPEWKLSLAACRVDGQPVDLQGQACQRAEGDRIELVLHGTPPPPAGVDAKPTPATAVLIYQLDAGADALRVTTMIANEGDEPLAQKLIDGDAARLDGEFQTGLDPELRLAWGVDRHWEQAYGIAIEEGTPRLKKDSRQTAPKIAYRKQDEVALPPGETQKTIRHVFPGRHLLAVKAMAARLRGVEQTPLELTISDDDGPVVDADVVFSKSGENQRYAAARTDDQGRIEGKLPPGQYQATISHHARRDTRGVLLEVAANNGPATFALHLPQAGYVAGRITDAAGDSIPCKIDFAPVGEGLPTPNFGPDSAIYGVRNLVYTPDGRFRVAVRPGKYDLLISHGPEYDVATRTIEVAAGEVAEFEAELPRSVETPGWVSAEYHSHSSPSGDNTASQRGRVLNLLAEHLEFAPCTEHNRITTYDEHLEAFGAQDRMASCPGMELTGSPLPLNHQNAFPLVHRPHEQDGGGPTTDADPVTQITRLAMWDDGSDKLVQTNHPNIPQMLGDRDLDGEADGGFAKMFDVMDVIEVHPPEKIFVPGEDLPTLPRERGNVIFHWMQLLNTGRRVPGVVNTDAHWNFHGSGYLRNYVRSSTDDPAAIDVAEMVRASEAGQIVITNGPYLEVSATAANASDQSATVGPGDDLTAPSGKVVLQIRVQCPNWLDVNRVQIFVNGRPRPDLNFTRPTARDKFQDGVVKFDETVEVSLREDAHLIVAAIGEGLQLGRVYGADRGEAQPTAVANPIYVDVDGDGFTANGDNLGVPLPTP